VESYNSVAELRVFFHAGVDFGDHCFGRGGFSPELLHCIVKALHFFRVTIPEFFLQITVELLCCAVKDFLPGCCTVGHDDVCVLLDGNVLYDINTSCAHKTLFISLFTTLTTLRKKLRSVLRDCRRLVSP